VLEVSGNWSEHGRTFLFREAPGEQRAALREPFTGGDVRSILHWGRA
jgi:hypothetical protein